MISPVIQALSAEARNTASGTKNIPGHVKKEHDVAHCAALEVASHSSNSRAKRWHRIGSDVRQNAGDAARIDDAQVARSICPYCGVGCGQLIFHKEGKLVSIEGDPESPISHGNLCPKGAASFQLLTHSRRYGITIGSIAVALSATAFGVAQRVAARAVPPTFSIKAFASPTDSVRQNLCEYVHFPAALFSTYALKFVR
jgi:hypothetical protein